VDAKFRENALRMVAGGVSTYSKCGGDRGVGAPLGQEHGDLHLASGQAVLKL
jgi:hypothetical protein